VHIVGIGGIGMSGIAEVMHVMGYEVQGSDLSENANTNRLAEMGVPILIGHREENITGAGVVTVSSAVADDNVEMQACARTPYSRCSPRRNAGRTHALKTVSDGRGHAWQNHHNLAGSRRA
jgi:UDP-N-acetylmuramate-alanine ligase